MERTKNGAAMMSRFVLLLAGVGILLLSSCEHQVTTGTRVQEDGRIEKEFQVLSSDTLDRLPHVGVGIAQGWAITRERVSDTTAKNRWIVVFRKSFASAEAANEELATPSDTLFRLRSTFDKRFRWFYSYIRYADIYTATNRFALPVTDFLNEQDFAFIARLPAEGRPMSRADSLFLESLNERILEHYFSRAYFDDCFGVLVRATGASDTTPWVQQKHRIYQWVLSKKDMDENFLPVLADSLGLSLDTTSTVYRQGWRAVEAKVKFMSWATEGKYVHEIEMPGRLISHNADSVSGNLLYWHPPALKFLFRDLVFEAEARVANVWAWWVSAAVLVASLLLWILRRRR